MIASIIFCLVLFGLLWLDKRIFKNISIIEAIHFVLIPKQIIICSVIGVFILFLDGMYYEKTKDLSVLWRFLSYYFYAPLISYAAVAANNYIKGKQTLPSWASVDVLFGMVSVVLMLMYTSLFLGLVSVIMVFIKGQHVLILRSLVIVFTIAYVPIIWMTFLEDLDVRDIYKFRKHWMILRYGFREYGMFLCKLILLIILKGLEARYWELSMLDLNFPLILLLFQSVILVFYNLIVFNLLVQALRRIKARIA